MENKQMDQSSQNSDSKSNQPTPETNKELQEKKPGINDPDKNDPTRNDKPPLIISKL